ncbi:rod shape-determining protein RodA [Patescibacteria group bacterium]
MKKHLSNLDWGIIGSAVLLSISGLVIIKSVAPDLFFHQLISFALGLLAYLLLAKIDFRVFQRLKYLIYFFCLLALSLTFVFGAVTRGSVRWLEVGLFTLQPSELTKPFLVLVFASFFFKGPVVNFSSLIANLFLLFIPVLLIFIQPDLGSSVVVVFFWVVMIFESGLPKKMVIYLLSLVSLALPLGWVILKNYQKERIMTFINPFSDPLGTGYNMIQAMIAVGSGQVFGRGLGRGPQSHLHFLPERHTDFIFASLSEELGFLGGLFIIVVYGFLFWSILKVAFNSREKFPKLVSLGVLGMIFFQFFVNVGMNLGLVPITGVTLPLVSYGGSSLLATMISLGIVQNIATYNKGKNVFLE